VPRLVTSVQQAVISRISAYKLDWVFSKSCDRLFLYRPIQKGDHLGPQGTTLLPRWLLELFLKQIRHISGMGCRPEPPPNAKIPRLIALCNHTKSPSIAKLTPVNLKPIESNRQNTNPTDKFHPPLGYIFTPKQTLLKLPHCFLPTEEMAHKP